MLLFSSSHARFTQIQIKVNRLKTSWALGAVLHTNTTEPLLQAEQCSHNRVTASSFSCCTSRKISLQRKTNQTPTHFKWTPAHHHDTGPRCHQVWQGPSCAAPHGPATHLCSCSTCHWAQGDAARHSLARAGWKPSTWSDLLCYLACYLLPHHHATDDRQLFLPVAQKWMWVVKLV